jgi:phage regulator Rha-like protein
MTMNDAIPEEVILSKIYYIRGQKIMLDQDLAELYGVETKQLKRQVRRNMTRFPIDFMYELTNEELQNLRSQIGTSSWGGTRYTPLAFTEQGVTMLSCVLNSVRSIEVNIRIIRIFTKLREIVMTHKDILLKLEQLEGAVTQQGHHLKKNEEDIQLIFNALKQLLTSPQEPRKPVGFIIPEQEDG